MKIENRLVRKPGHTSSIRRIEGGMLSYHADMDASTNPFELGLDRLVDLKMRLILLQKIIAKDCTNRNITKTSRNRNRRK